MTLYVARRLLLALPTLLAVTFLVFAGVRMAPGDPALNIAGQQATQDVIEKIRREMGLDQPFLTQYIRYMQGLAKMDLGRSMFSNLPVAEEIMPRYPVTLTVAAASTILAAFMGIALGVMAATRQRTWADYFSMSLSSAGLSIPNFVLALVLVLFLSIRLRLLPSTGSGTLLHFVLPTITLGVPAGAVIARMTRGSMLEVLRQDYVRTARAKGVPERSVVYRHAFRNALIPVLTVLGLQFGQLIGGAVVVESVFGLPGIGKLLVDRILARDYPVVQGAVLFAACSFVLINVVVDFAYAITDPRVRFS